MQRVEENEYLFSVTHGMAADAAFEKFANTAFAFDIFLKKGQKHLFDMIDDCIEVHVERDTADDYVKCSKLNAIKKGIKLALNGLNENKNVRNDKELV